MAAAERLVVVRRNRAVAALAAVHQAHLPWIPIVVLTVLLVAGLGADVIAPYDPTSSDLRNRQLAPFENLGHPLGTDITGQDILSRLIFGARTVLQVTVPSIGIAIVVGTIVGLVSGYGSRLVDSVLMRITDGTMGFPSILVAMLIVTLVGTGLWGVIIAVTATVWARFARMIRGEVLSIRQQDFVIRARTIGVPAVMIIRRHLFPNTVNTLMVMTSLTIGQVILLEAALSFLGLGMPPGEPAWGIMVAEGRDQLVSVWWLALLPGIAITMVVMAFNFFGDWLRDFLDPKLRRSR